MISKSSDKHTQQKENHIKRCLENGTDPSEYVTFLNDWEEKTVEKEADPAWAKNNLEYDLRTTAWILNKVRSSDEYAQELYAALCNNKFVKREMWEILKDEPWGCSWRYAGGILADMRQQGDYMDWYCSGNEGNISATIDDDLYTLGWIIAK